MAIQTRIVGSIADAAGEAILSYTWDDVGLFLTSATLENNSAHVANVSFTRTSDGRVYGPWSVAAGQSVTQNIPTNGQNRFGLTLLPSGRLDGCDIQFWLT